MGKGVVRKNKKSIAIERPRNLSSFLSKINAKYMLFLQLSYWPTCITQLGSPKWFKLDSFAFSGDVWQFLRERWCEICGYTMKSASNSRTLYPKVTQRTSVKTLNGFPALQCAYCISADDHLLSLYFITYQYIHSSENCIYKLRGIWFALTPYKLLLSLLSHTFYFSILA